MSKGCPITETKRIVFRFHYHSQKVIGSLGNRKYIFKWWIFHCCVCLPECKRFFFHSKTLHTTERKPHPNRIPPFFSATSGQRHICRTKRSIRKRRKRRPKRRIWPHAAWEYVESELQNGPPQKTSDKQGPFHSIYRGSNGYTNNPQWKPMCLFGHFIGVKYNSIYNSKKWLNLVHHQLISVILFSPSKNYLLQLGWGCGPGFFCLCKKTTLDGWSCGIALKITRILVNYYPRKLTACPWKMMGLEDKPVLLKWSIFRGHVNSFGGLV